MGESAHGRKGGALLAAALRGSADEDADVFAIKPARLPLLAGLVPEGFPLGREVAVAGRDAEEEGVVLFELVGRDERDGARLARRVHLGQHFLGQRLFDSVCERRGRVSFSVSCALGVRELRVLWFKSVCMDGIGLDWSGNALVDVRHAAGGFNAGFFGFGYLCDVAVHGILCQLSQYIL